MKQFLGGLFNRLGTSPYDYVARGDFAALEHLYYRFQKGAEIIDLFMVLNRIVKEYGTIGRLIETHYKGDIRAALWAVRERLFGDDGARHLFFFPKRSPSNPLKRWNLYLRWMVRRDAIDVGIWGFIPKRELIVPLDTHLYKIGRCMGWTDRRTQSWNAACDITAALKEACPDDPLKYDFLLCHVVGMDAKCSGTRGASCSERCVLYEV
jgi:uncharacterized protein (TIGR02757 family)